MKVLFATDGSDSAAHARNLIASLAWPAATKILVLHVIAPASELIGMSTAVEGTLRQAVDRELEATRQALAAAGREVDSVVTVGRPASTIVDDAREIAADLIVLGSRGRGAFASAVLGSVAAEVVDYAPCPVLVARGDEVTGIVLAHDGSPGARQAEAVLLGMPVLGALPVRVISAWSVLPSVTSDPTGSSFISGDLYDQFVREARTYATEIARAAVGRLVHAGRTASALVAEASAADAIASAAGPADLIVIGTRGQTGLARLLLGSVARGVLHRARSSILFVPQAVPRP
jgi:nucleotide-binding universal stress UspA family protein